MRKPLLQLNLLGTLLLGMLVVGSSSPAWALPLKLIPQTGLELHLDGENPLNTASTWFDRSISANHGTVNSATHNAGVGYSFDGIDDFVSISNSTVYTAAKFAYAVRLSASATQAALTSGQRYFLGDQGSSWNDMYYDYGNNAITWDTRNNAAATSSNNFRSAPKQTARNFTGEHMIGVTFEAINATDQTGTARLYVDGVFIGQATGSYKPDFITNHALINRIGRNSATFWQGEINEVILYRDYLGSPDDLMNDLFLGLPQPVIAPAPEPATSLLLVCGMAGIGILRRRQARKTSDF